MTTGFVLDVTQTPLGSYDMMLRYGGDDVFDECNCNSAIVKYIQRKKYIISKPIPIVLPYRLD